MCHPDWRGVRTAAYAFRSPVVECDDLERWAPTLLAGLGTAGIDTVIIQGWPPGSGDFAAAAHAAGVVVKCILHSSPAQHGAEAGEASVVDEVLSLASRNVLNEVGMVKDGVAEAFRASGHPVTYVPNRAPVMPEVAKVDLGPGLHIGIFAEPFWRKNVVTQLLALGLVDGAKGHVLSKPPVDYLDGIEIMEHGEMPWDDFLALQGSVDLNLYVTLTECHPLMPVESYLLGVPCLISRTSSLFRDDPWLWEASTVEVHDEPTSVARAAMELLERRETVIDRAVDWIRRADTTAGSSWDRFVGAVPTREAHR
ncbi:MAG: hypothetical protein ACRDWS_09415 [Acidimicrobiia bacterium]